MFNEEKVFLPWSGKRYKVTATGKVFDYLENEIHHSIENEEQYVELEWVLGKRKYLLSSVILFGFGKVKLPEYLFDLVEPLYIDNNKNNLFLVNLIYRFKKYPLEVEGYPGYYYIPFYNGYAISKNGDLINVSTGKSKVWSITKTGGIKNQTGGYLYSRCITEEGISKILFLHRALCLTFKKYDNTVLSIVVNHIDGKPSNNHLDNLEWCTYSENNLHAVRVDLRPNSSLPILMKDLKSGLVTRFESVTACCRYLGHNGNSFIYYRLRDNPNKVYSDLLLFKYEDSAPWPEIDLSIVKINNVGAGDKIYARNVFTGDILLFNGCAKGEEYTGVCQMTIARHVRENCLIPCKGYNFRYHEYSNDWPIHTVRHLKIYEKYPVYPPNGCILTDINNSEEIFYCSAAEAANALKIDKALISKLIRNKLLWKNKYLLSYFNIKENLSPVIA